MSPEGELQPSDSAPVLRFDRAARRIDTVAYTRLAKSNTQVSGGRGNMEIRIGGGNPLTPQDDWAVLPDGRVAVIRATDYHLDVFTSQRSKVAGAPIAYEKIKVDAAVKQMVEDQRARASRNAIRMTMDVFAAAGRVIGKVALPVKSRLVGFGQGTVYLVRVDDDDLQYLQRYRLPMVRS